MNEGTIEKEKIYKETEDYGRVQFVDKIYELRNSCQKYKNFMEYYRSENNHLKETNEEHLKINGDLRKENQELKEDIEEISTSHFILFKRYDKTEKENQKLVKVIDELKKHICSEWYCFDNESVEFEVAKDILNKLTELKGGSDESIH